MRPLHEVGTRTFAWRPVKGEKRTIELYAGDEIFAILRQERGQPAFAETAEGQWLFEREKDTITVRGSDAAIAATYSAEASGEGFLTLADGQLFRWAPTRKGTAERAFSDASGARVVRFWKETSLFKVTDQGAADLGMAALPAFPLLVVLGRVIGVGNDADAAMIAAVSVTS